MKKWRFLQSKNETEALAAEFLISLLLVLGLSMFWNLWNLDAIKVFLSFGSGKQDLLKNAFFSIQWVSVFWITVVLTILAESIRSGAERTVQIRRCFHLLLVLSLLLIYGRFILTNCWFAYVDMGSDTWLQYYPFYMHEVMKIRDGAVGLWDWNFGLGVSSLQLVLWAFDPFSWIVVLPGIIFGEGAVREALIYMQIVKILTIYLLSRKYLTYFVKNETALGLGAILMALNGYLIVWGQHYFLGTACFFHMLIFLSLESMLRKEMKGSWKLAVSVMLVMMGAFYTGYMSLLTAAVYFLIRYFMLNERRKIREIARDFGICLGSVFSGIFLAGIVFLPSAYFIFSSSSRLSETSESLIESLRSTVINSFRIDEFMNRMSRLMSSGGQFIRDSEYSFFGNLYESEQLFFTIFIFFIAAAWVAMEIRKTKKNGRWGMFIVCMLLMIFLIFSQTAALVMNAFAYPSYRYSFVLIPFAGIMIAQVTEAYFEANEEGKSPFTVVTITVGLVISLVVWVYSYKTGSMEVRKYVYLLLELFLIGTILLWLSKKAQGKAQIFMLLFILLIIGTTAADAFFVTNRRDVMRDRDFGITFTDGELSGDTVDALNYIKSRDDSFYRVEKNYADLTCLDSLIHDYSTLIWYNSAPNHNLADFYEHIVNREDGNLSYTWWGAKKYLNRHAMNLVNSQYLLSREPVTEDGFTSIGQFGSVIVYRNEQTNGLAKWFNTYLTEDEFEALSEEEKTEVLSSCAILRRDEAAGEISKKLIHYSFEEVMEKADPLFETPLYKESDTKIVGTRNCDENGLLMIAIPDENGWEITVDNQATEKVNVDYGFIGVYLEAGDHEIEVTYHVPYGKAGVLMSIAGAVMLAALIMIDRERKTNPGKKAPAEQENAL